MTESYQADFLANINVPIGQSQEDKLANLHVYDLNQDDSSFDMGRKIQQPVLNVELYLMVEDRLKEIYVIKIAFSYNNQG